MPRPPKPTSCCAVGCRCTKPLFSFTKGIADTYNKQTGKGGGKLKFSCKWGAKDAVLCAPCFMKVIHKVYGKSINGSEDPHPFHVGANRPRLPARPTAAR